MNSMVFGLGRPMVLLVFGCSPWLAACGASPGGGSGGAAVMTVGGAAGTTCSPQYHNEGCHVVTQPALQFNRMKCGASGQWELLETCNATEANGRCKENLDPNAPGTAKRVSECYVVQQVTPTPDAVSGGDSTSSGDAATGGDSGATDVVTLIKCLQQNCAAQVAACKQDAVCGMAWTCAEGCQSEACVDACPELPDSNALGQSLLACGIEKQCIVFPTGECGDEICDDGEDCPEDCDPPGPTCGNGQCEAGENQQTCPADCKATGPTCGNGQCEAGENQQTCPADCKATGPTCGNGQCEAGENQQTCPADCKGGASVCGDAICDEQCPMDCEPMVAVSLGCAKSKCPNQMSACSADPSCVALFNCLASCKCSESCLKQQCAPLVQNISPATEALGTCAEDAECPSPCDMGSGGCSSDAECPPGSTCANGTCVPAGGHFCDANCGKNGDSCFCDAECIKFGDCCDPTGTQPAGEGEPCSGSTCADCNP